MNYIASIHFFFFCSAWQAIQFNKYKDYNDTFQKLVLGVFIFPDTKFLSPLFLQWNEINLPLDINILNEIHMQILYTNAVDMNEMSFIQTCTLRNAKIQSKCVAAILTEEPEHFSFSHN